MVGSAFPSPFEGPAVMITAVCPRCKTSYQVQDELRGRPMRCPLPACRQVFIVGVPQPPSNPGPPPATGLVGDLVPLVPTESDAPSAPAGNGTHVSDVLELLPAEPIGASPPAGRAPPPWHEAPPLRRSTQTTGPARPATQLSPEEGGPRVVAFDAGHAAAPPPVRRGDDKADPLERAPGPAGAPPPRAAEEHAPAARPRRRWVWVVLTLLVLVGGAVGG